MVSGSLSIPSSGEEKRAVRWGFIGDHCLVLIDGGEKDDEVVSRDAMRD